MAPKDKQTLGYGFMAEAGPFLNQHHMDLQDQLKNLFPGHVPEIQAKGSKKTDLYLQEDPIICKYEKRKGKPITILEGYHGTDEDLKQMAKLLKTKLNVGGSAKEGKIIIQGNFRDKIMELLKNEGFKVKRVGG
jgi:translation initiation factor 1